MVIQVTHKWKIREQLAGLKLSAFSDLVLYTIPCLLLGFKFWKRPDEILIFKIYILDFSSGSYEWTHRLIITNEKWMTDSLTVVETTRGKNLQYEINFVSYVTLNFHKQCKNWETHNK